MTCRPAGFAGLAPIPWDTVLLYCKTNEFDMDQTSNLHYFVRKMDEALIKWEKGKHGNK